MCSSLDEAVHSLRKEVTLYWTSLYISIIVQGKKTGVFAKYIIKFAHDQSW